MYLIFEEKNVELAISFIGMRECVEERERGERGGVRERGEGGDGGEEMREG